MPPSFDQTLAAANRRELAQPFTQYTRFHHPQLNSDFDETTEDLVPADLTPRKGLRWDLPKASDDSLQDQNGEADRNVASLEGKFKAVHESLNALERDCKAQIEPSFASPVDVEFQSATDTTAINNFLDHLSEQQENPSKCSTLKREQTIGPYERFVSNARPFFF